MPTSLGESTTSYVPPQRIHTDSNGKDTGSGLWDEGGFSFSDFLDVINPLQHIPIVSNLYRNLTGDDIGQIPRVIGGALFGGAIGFIASLLNAIVDEETGKDVGEHAVAVLFGDDEDDSSPGSPNITTVATASAFSPANDAIFHGDAAPAFPAPDAPPVMLAAAETPANAFESAGAVVAAPLAAPKAATPTAAAPLATPTAASPLATPTAASAAAPAAAEIFASATKIPAAVPAATSPAALPLSARPAALLEALIATHAAPQAGPPTRTSAAIIPAAARTGSGAGPEIAQAKAEIANTEKAEIAKSEKPERAALLSRFSGGEKAAPTGPWISQAMMYGLDRYETMARERMRAKPDIDSVF